MKIHFLQHVHYETPAYLIDWAEANRHEYSITELYKNKNLPGKEEFDFLVVMGGPMNIYEEEKYPWLAEEKKFIRKAIDSGKHVLGICLGSQLIADALGAKVYPNRHKEIGWFPVFKNEFSCFTCTRYLDREIPTFHWHGETFDLPSGTDRLYSSEATPNQGFAYGENVVALQFHWEVKRENIEEWLSHASNDLTPGPYVQSVEQMLKHPDDFDYMNGRLEKLLFSFTKNI